MRQEPCSSVCGFGEFLGGVIYVYEYMGLPTVFCVADELCETWKPPGEPPACTPQSMGNSEFASITQTPSKDVGGCLLQSNHTVHETACYTPRDVLLEVEVVTQFQV